MINSVSIQNFKILEKLENVPLSKITLFGGKNNTGKTTILEALFLYFDFNTPEVFDKLFSWREFSGIWAPNEVGNKFFHDTDLTKEVIITTDSGKTENGQLKIGFLENYETPVQIADVEYGVTTFKKNFPAFEIVFTLNNSIDYLAHILCLKTNRNYLREINKLQGQPEIFYMGERMKLYVKNHEYLGVLDKTDEQEKILPLLRLFEPNLKCLQLINDSGNNVIYADFGNRKKIPVNMLGDGFCRCLTIALVLATKNAKIFLIDEVGSGIHYSMQEDIWIFLTKASELYDCQIIATTHSHDTIKAFNNIVDGGNESYFSYIRLEKGKDSIKTHIFTPELLKYSLSSKLELR